MLFNLRKRFEPHLVDALDVMRIEFAAVRGRRHLPKQLPTQAKEYLQLGCGGDHIIGFLNTDYFLNPEADVGIDMRFPLRFPDNTWKGVYAHHSVEHIDYPDAYRLFREIRRVLRPGGVFRMIVPDLEVFLRCYASTDQRKRAEIFSIIPPNHMQELSFIKTPLEMIDYIFRDNKFNRHLSTWDWETAQFRLTESGFSRVVRQKVNVSLDPMLAGHDKKHWEKHSLYVEAVK
jgi:predicted SAM-dependent methyltransferase